MIINLKNLNRQTDKKSTYTLFLVLILMILEKIKKIL